MAKDVAKLRAKEAQEERERISKITITPESQPKPIPPPLMPHEEKQKPSFTGQRMVLPKARTRFEKILIRFVVAGVLVFILVNGIAFGYWYFTKKRVLEITPSPQPTPEAAAGEAEPIPSLFSLFQTLLAKEDAQGLTTMPVKGKVSELPFPAQLKEIIQDEFVIFSFVSQDKKRLGFMFQLQNAQEAPEILFQWEPSMEGDLKHLWDSIGQKGSAYVPFFRQTSYQNSVIRFQTFSVKDFGIVYALKGNTLFITSSLESMKAAVDQIIQSK